MNNKVIALLDSVRQVTDDIYVGKIDADRYAVISNVVHGPYTKISILGADILSVIEHSNGIHLIGSAGIKFKANDVREFEEAIKELLPNTLKSEKIQAALSEVLEDNKEKIWGQKYEKIDTDIVELSGMISFKIRITVVLGLGHRCVIISARDRFQFVEGLYSLDTNTWIGVPSEGSVTIKENYIAIVSNNENYKEMLGRNLIPLVATPHNNMEFEKIQSKSNNSVYYSEITDRLLLKAYTGAVVQELVDKQSGETIINKIAGVGLYGGEVLILQTTKDELTFNTYLLGRELRLVAKSNVFRVVSYRKSRVRKEVIKVEYGHKRLLVIIDNGIIKILSEADKRESNIGDEVKAVDNAVYESQDTKEAFTVRVIKHRRYEV